MSYNIKTTRIFFQREDGTIAIAAPTGELPVEVVATRDLPPNTPYWIFDGQKYVDMENQLFNDLFASAFELDKKVLGTPHGVSLGYEEWVKRQPKGTPGL